MCTILVVDSTSPVELLFVFSSLSNWREGGKDTHRFQLSRPSSHPPRRGSSPAYRPTVAVSVMSDQQRPPTPSTPSTLHPTEENTSMIEGEGGGVSSRRVSSAMRRSIIGKILPGNLVMETYSWRTARFGDPVLQVATTGINGATFSLPAG